MENRDFPESRPVIAYWILENGRREKLNSIEKEYAYGIVRQEKLAKDKLKVMLAAFKSLESSSKESTILLNHDQGDTSTKKIINNERQGFLVL